MRAFVSALCLAAVLAAVPAAAQSSNPFDNFSEALTTEDTRLTTGVESVQTSASTPQQHFLIDFMLTAPVGKQVTRAEKPVFGAWLNARFHGAPTNAVSGVKQFVGGFEKDLVSGSTTDLLNTLLFRAGVEIGARRKLSFDFGSDFQFQPTFIAAFGIQTVPELKTPSVFDLPAHTDDPNDKFSNLPYERWGIPTDKGYKYVSLGDPDRRRFYKSFEFGLRLKTHHFNDCKSDAPPDCSTDRRRNFPGMVDLTLGQDAAITGGERRGMVGRIDGFYPLPAHSALNAVYLFGALRVHWVDGVDAEQDPVILRAPSAAVTLPSSEVFEHVLTPDERTRDEWKFGMGVDLVRLFTAASEKRSSDKAGEEDGSILVLDENPDVVAMSRVIQPNETRTFNHGADIVVAKRDATLEVNPPLSTGSKKLDFKQDVPVVVLSTKRTLKNTTAMDFGVVVIRVKPGDPKAEFPTGGKTSETVTRVETKFRVSTVDCSAKCDYVFKKDEVDNTVVLLPLADVKDLPISGDKVTKKAYEAIAVGRKVAIDLSESKAKFIVVRIR